MQPSFDSTSFTCPSCEQLSEQAWFSAYAEQIKNPAGVPLRIKGAGLEQLKQNPQFPPEVRRQKVEYWEKVNRGEVFLDRWAPTHTDLFVAGMEFSVCHACMNLAIWLGGELIYPTGAAREGKSGADDI